MLESQAIPGLKKKLTLAPMGWDPGVSRPSTRFRASIRSSLEKNLFCQNVATMASNSMQFMQHKRVDGLDEPGRARP